MARRVDFHITLDISINESDLALLRLFGRLAGDSGEPTMLTARACAQELGVSVPTVRRSCRTLARKGLVVTRDSVRSDGGRDANAYEVTPLGTAVLGSEGAMRPRRIPKPLHV